MAEALYRKWRPRSWDEVVGQDHVIVTLHNATKRERLSHAYLFSGPRGTGKTTTARILAKASNCLAENPADRPCNQCVACVAVNEGRYLDLIEIDAASNTSVDDVRDLRDRINFAPNEGRYKVYIIDEVHMLSTAAFNALLKTLEEPPPHAIFVLATTEVHKVPATVLSRCQRHEFRRIPAAEIRDYLTQQSKEAEFEVEPAAMQLIARQATGSLRDAISLLDQLVSMGKIVTLEETQEVLGTATDDTVGEIVEALIDGNIGSGLSLIDRSLDAGVDPRQFARQIVGWLRALLLIRTGDEEAADEAMPGQAEKMEVGQLLLAMKAFSSATRAGRTAWQPGLALELAFMESIGGPKHESVTMDGDTAGRDAHSAEGTSRSAPSDPRAPAEREPPATPDPPADPSALEVEERGGVRFQELLDTWPDLLAAAYRRDPQAQALLNSCKPLGVRDNALVLGFQSDLLRERMEKGHNQQIVTEALQEVLNEPVGLRCVLLEDWGTADSPSIPIPPMQETGMVAAALRDLGAEVVDYGPITEDPASARVGDSEGQGTQKEDSESEASSDVLPDQVRTSEGFNEEGEK